MIERTMVPQLAVSVTSDFGNRTWTFLLGDDMLVSAGEFYIVPKEQFKVLETAINNHAEGRETSVGVAVDPQNVGEEAASNFLTPVPSAPSSAHGEDSTHSTTKGD